MAETTKAGECGPETPHKLEKMKDSPAKRAFMELYEKIDSENWVRLGSREKGVEALFMRVTTGYGSEKGANQEGNLVIRYQKVIRAGKKDMVFGTNEFKTHAEKRLSEAESNLKQAQKEGNAEMARVYGESARMYREQVRKETDVVTVDLGQQMLEATVTLDPETGKFYYSATVSSWDARIKNVAGGGLKIHKSFTGTADGEDVSVSEGKALQMITRMKQEFDAATEGKAIQKNTSLLLSELDNDIKEGAPEEMA